jgi:GH24 family phage-related lysozyme (muramidase)
MKSFKKYIYEATMFPPQFETAQVEKVEVTPPVATMGSDGQQYKAKVKFAVPEEKPKQTSDYDYARMSKVIRQYESGGNEKKILNVYKDSKGLPTIGHGHLVTKDSSKIFGDVFGEEHKTNPSFAKDVLSGKKALTPEQADKLLQRDIKTRLPQVEKMLPNFKKYSPELQTELASEHFRGMLGKSPNTVKLINQGKFEEAASAFLDADEYRKSKTQKTGIAGRMENMSKALKTESAPRKPQQPSS